MPRDLESNPTWLPVVAAALFDASGRILMQKRPAGKAHAGLWEFPGGKVESHETPAFALVREIEEELSLRLDPTSLVPACFAESAEQAGEMPIVILLYSVASWEGEPRGEDGSELGWFTFAQAAALPLPPLDVDLLHRLERIAA